MSSCADLSECAGTRPKVHQGFYRAWTEKQLDQEIMEALEVRWPCCASAGLDVSLSFLVHTRLQAAAAAAAAAGAAWWRSIAASLHTKGLQGAARSRV